jgi:hypothetical protein
LIVKPYSTPKASKAARIHPRLAILTAMKRDAMVPPTYMHRLSTFKTAQKPIPSSVAKSMLVILMKKAVRSRSLRYREVAV